MIDVASGAADTHATSLPCDPLESSEIKEYQVTTRNLEKFLDVPPTDDNYYIGINKKLPCGSSNGLAYVDDGYGAVLKIQFVRKEYAGAKK